MFDSVKNPTPITLALATALATVIFVLVASIVLMLMGSLAASVFILALFAIAVGAVVFGVSYYMIRIFVFRKIKLIYKIISSTKRPSTEAGQGLEVDSNMLNQTQNDVEQWMQKEMVARGNEETREQFRREFLSNVSHELKTPIFNVQGYIETLLDGGLDDREVNMDYLQKAGKGMERMINIVDDLQTISMLESGKLPLDKRTFDITELIKDVFASIDMTARDKLVTLSIKEGCDEPHYVKADKERIRQVLVNLLVNAINYGKWKGIAVVGIYDMDDNLLVEITDDGIGISESHLPRLFERFYRVDRGRSRQDGGTGLGLAIVKHIIEGHGQQVNVRSKPNVGSTFGFKLARA